MPAGGEMDKGTSGYILLGAGLVLVVGGGYVFLNLTRGGVNPATLGSFGAILVGIVLMVIGRSRSSAAAHEGLAEEVGLEVKDAVGLAGSERVEMEGDIGGFRAQVSRREVRHRRPGFVSQSRMETYIFRIEVPNPSGLSFHVGSDSFFSTPLGSLPPKLNTAAWEWANFVSVRAAPPEAAAEFFGDPSAVLLFREFFGKVTCTLNHDTLEFKPATRTESALSREATFLESSEVKDLLEKGAEVARRIAALKA